MNNKEAGVAYAVITGKKGYVGSVVKEFEITPAKSILRLKREIKAVTYNGKLQKPKVSVMAGSKTLKAGRDYTVSYSKNLHASKVRNQKEAVVTITGKGNYRGGKSSFNFEIKPQNIKKVSVKGTSKVLNLTYAKHALLKDHDYTIGETVNAGKKVNITIIGHGDFQGSVVKKVKE
jgi:hypothetical protein